MDRYTDVRQIDRQRYDRKTDIIDREIKQMIYRYTTDRQKDDRQIDRDTTDRQIYDGYTEIRQTDRQRYDIIDGYRYDRYTKIRLVNIQIQDSQTKKYDRQIDRDTTDRQIDRS